MDTTEQQTMDSDMNHVVNNNGNGSYSQNNAKERCSGEIGNDSFVNIFDMERVRGVYLFVYGKKTGQKVLKNLCQVLKLHIQVLKLHGALISKDLDSNMLPIFKETFLFDF